MSSDNTKSNSTVAAAIQLPEEEYNLSEISVVESSYPTGKVIIIYLLFGGPIGGVILIAFMLVGSFNLRDFYLIFIGLVFGFVFGVIPATITGFLIAGFKFYRTFKELFWSAIIGACTTIVVTVFIVSDVSFVVFRLLIGATSAVLTGLFALPKISKNNFNKINIKDYDI